MTIVARLGLSGMIFFASTQIVHAVCVENGTEQRLFFTIESRPAGLRQTGWLKPDKKLCLPEASGAVFTTFASEVSVEGCPRLSGTGGTERLIAFLPADACRWASHGR